MIIVNKDPTLIQFRHVSCDCVSCANRNFDTECELAIHVPNWTLVRLEPNDQLQVRDEMLQEIEDEEIEFGIGGE